MMPAFFVLLVFFDVFFSLVFVEVCLSPLTWALAKCGSENISGIAIANTFKVILQMGLSNRFN